MYRWILAGFACLVGFVPLPTLGQESVGAPGGQFLTLPTSPRLHAMSDAGVALYDAQGWLVNPAMAGLAGRVVLSPYTWTSFGEARYSLAGVVIPSRTFSGGGSGRHGGAFAYSFTRLASGGVDEVDYSGVPTGNSWEWSDVAHQWTVAYVWRGKIEIAVGTTVKYIRMAVSDNVETGAAFDAGLVVRKPYVTEDLKGSIKVTPSAGIALANAGPAISMFEDEYPLPRVWRLGGALEVAFDRPGPFSSWRQLSGAVTAQLDRAELPAGREWVERYGIELGLFEAVQVRAGHSISGYDNFPWGFSLHLAGLTKVVLALAGQGEEPGPVARFFMERLQVSYSEAHGDLPHWELDTPYRGFVFGLRW